MKRISAGIGAGVLLCLLVVSIVTAQPAATQTITYLNVGQGDAAIIQDGSGYAVLIDGGETNQGDTVLAALRARGITRLRAVLATHPHADHIGGLTAVMNAPDIQIDQVYTNGCPGSTVAWQTFSAAVTARGLTLTPLTFPQVLTWGSMEAHVLSPAPEHTCPEDDPNLDSVVVRLDYQQMNALFTGDINAAVEATVVARGTPVAAEVLKVAHHGSASGSSQAFLAAALPELAVISVGDGNRYGHPAQDTLGRLSSAGAVVDRTDLLGTIVVTSDGFTFSVNPPMPETSFPQYLPLIVK